MMNNETNEVTYSTHCGFPAKTSIGSEGHGFRHILDGWNAERILIAAECVGDGRWFIERAAGYAKIAPGLRPPASAPTRESSFPWPPPGRRSKLPT